MQTKKRFSGFSRKDHENSFTEEEEGDEQCGHPSHQKGYPPTPEAGHDEQQCEEDGEEGGHQAEGDHVEADGGQVAVQHRVALGAKGREDA